VTSRERRRLVRSALVAVIAEIAATVAVVPVVIAAVVSASVRADGCVAPVSPVVTDRLPSGVVRKPPHMADPITGAPRSPSKTERRWRVAHVTA